ncbi:MAG: hypothetical protein AAGE94_11520 [Acidobacteriota bacterium]
MSGTDILSPLSEADRRKTALALRTLLALEPRDEPRRQAARARAIESRLDPDLDSTDRGLDPAEDSPWHPTLHRPNTNR